MAPQDYGDTDPNNIPDDQSAPSSAPPSAGDGLPGYPLIGAPGWRAGVPGAPNVLGMVQVSPGDQDASAAPFAGPGDPRLIQTADGGPMNPAGALDYERNSWRWNDVDALTYDLQRKQEELAQAQALMGAAGAANRATVNATSKIAGAAGKPDSSAAAFDPWNAARSLFSLDTPVGAATAATGAYMQGAEVPMLTQEIQALQDRLAQLRAASST